MAKQLIVILSFAAVVVLLSSGGLVYLSIDIAGNVKKIKSLRSDLAFSHSITQSLFNLKIDLKSVQPYLGTLDKILSNRDQLIKFSGDVNTLASQNTISATSEFSSESKSSEGLASIGVNMTAEGGFNNLINYLKALENSRYSIKIDVVDFYKNADKIKAQMSGKVFYIIENEK